MKYVSIFNVSGSVVNARGPLRQAGFLAPTTVAARREFSSENPVIHKPFEAPESTRPDTSQARIVGRLEAANLASTIRNLHFRTSHSTNINTQTANVSHLDLHTCESN